MALQTNNKLVAGFFLKKTKKKKINLYKLQIFMFVLYHHNALMHNVPKWSDTLKILQQNAARFLTCV